MSDGTARHAAAYYRVSGRGQVNGDGPERQDDKICRYAEANGIQLVLGSSDLGVSGKVAYEERPGLGELLAFLSQNPDIRLIIVERADRLARDLIVQELTVRECQRIGIEIIEAEGGQSLTDSDDPTRKLIRQVLGAISEWEKDSIVLKLRAARERIKSKTGKCEGRKAFGENNQELPALDRMLDLRGRASCRDIAAVLNSEGYRTREGKPWHFASVAKIVRRNSQTKSKGEKADVEYVS